MTFAEQFAVPVEGEIGTFFPRCNEFGAVFQLRWCRLVFDVRWGSESNVKVIVKVGRSGGVCEHYLVETDACAAAWNHHRRVTRDFFLLPDRSQLGRALWVKFSFVVHLRGASIPSQHDYLLIDGARLVFDRAQITFIPNRIVGVNSYRTHEVDAALLQRDVDWYNHHFESLHVVPKFTKGTPSHPFHPKRTIHDLIDKTIRLRRERLDRPCGIKVCVDCIDDTDFVTHLLYAHENGVSVQCLVDWRKMMLTDSSNYARLLRSTVELVGVFCIQRHPLIEVAPDMHTKFIIFGEDDCMEGSFNIGFERWGTNWESGLHFQSQGVCRLLDNIFQSIRGGVIQPYGIDPYSPFNLLYTFGAHTMLNGKTYRPNHAIISEINRARHSLRLCLFTIGEMRGEHGESVIDALIRARHRGVDVRIIVNGHIVRTGEPGREYSMSEELRRPIIPAVARLIDAGLPVALAYGKTDHRIPYCPIHSKYCIIDETILLKGSFNWYNTSVYSHDLLILVASEELTRSYLHEFNQILRLFRFPMGAGSSPFTVSRACAPAFEANVRG